MSAEGRDAVPLLPERLPDVRLGRLVAYLGAGRVVVDVFLARGPLMGRCLATMTDDELVDAVARNARVKVAFENGDLNRPVVIELVEGRPAADVSVTVGPAQRVEVAHEWVLRCGKTSLTLRADGTMLIEGTKIETREPQEGGMEPHARKN
jgi:hypothetical protein